MPSQAVGGALLDLRKNFSRIVPIEELIDGALALARDVRHPLYDCVYLQLALQLDAQMITADQKLSDQLAPTPYARHLVRLSDWRP